MAEKTDIEWARDQMREARDKLANHEDPEIQKMGKVVDLFIIASYSSDEIGRLCDVFDSYLNDLLGGPN